MHTSEPVGHAQGTRFAGENKKNRLTQKDAFGDCSKTGVLGGSWDLVTTYKRAYKPLYNRTKPYKAT